MRDAFDIADRARLRQQADLYDVSKPAHENENFIQQVRDAMEGWEKELGAEMRTIREEESRNSSEL